ncbi:MAG: hypothetical protein JNM70_09085 [Anaerolineae bacterium]|nr:hypothetical protein [Anaerolineae bacterium]
MSGLFGLIDSAHPDTIPVFLKQAAAQLTHFDWHRSEEWISPDGCVGLGRQHIGVFNAEPQPLFSADGHIAVLLAGELYHQAALKARLEAARQPVSASDDLALILAAYQAWGEDFVKHLEGVFVIGIHDAQRRHFLLTTDRFGRYPTYYAHQPGRLAFSPEVKGVACAPFVGKKLNHRAVAEYVRFQHLLERKTFHEDIEVLPYGGLLRFDYDSGLAELSRYWDWDQIPFNPQVTFDEAVEEAGRRLEQAVHLLTADSLRPGIFLSGGLDSRSILGLMPSDKSRPVTATFGVHNARDVYYAEQIARARKTQHHWFDLPNGRWVLDQVPLHFELTEGFHHWVHMHGITMLPTLRGLIDYNLTGWDGGTVMMNPPEKSMLLMNHAPDHAAILSYLFEGFAHDYTWPGLTESEDAQLFAPGVRQQLTGLAFQSMREEFQRYEGIPLLYRGEYFYLVNHCFRMTLHMNTVARSHFEVRFPFFDYALIDYVYSLPLDKRDLLYRTIITQKMPDLAMIPSDKQEYLPTVRPYVRNLHALSVRARRRLGLYPRRATLYADYENYLRHDLRQWAESILFDPRTEARGLFDPAFVRSLFERHMQNYEQWTIGKIAPLITLEMVLRRFFD